MSLTERSSSAGGIESANGGAGGRASDGAVNGTAGVEPQLPTASFTLQPHSWKRVPHMQPPPLLILRTSATRSTVLNLPAGCVLLPASCRMSSTYSIISFPKFRTYFM